MKNLSSIITKVVVPDNPLAMGQIKWINDDGQAFALTNYNRHAIADPLVVCVCVVQHTAKGITADCEATSFGGVSKLVGEEGFFNDFSI
jgi:hypothetical protein